jgi:hypothetical protein
MLNKLPKGEVPKEMQDNIETLKAMGFREDLAKQALI